MVKNLYFLKIIHMPKLTIPKENVIGLAQEPIPFLLLNDEFIKYTQKHIGKYYVSDKNNLPEPFIEGNSFLCYDRPILDTYKPKLMSIMVSQKMYAPGHIYRHELVQKILQTNLPIDIWGRGCYHYKDSRIKGTFTQFELINITLLLKIFKQIVIFQKK